MLLFPARAAHLKPDQLNRVIADRGYVGELQRIKTTPSAKLHLWQGPDMKLVTDGCTCGAVSVSAVELHWIALHAVAVIEQLKFEEGDEQARHKGCRSEGTGHWRHHDGHGCRSYPGGRGGPRLVDATSLPAPWCCEAC